MIFKTSEKFEQALLSTFLYIQTHLEQDLSLEVLAKRVGFSAFHFHRIFREVIGEAVKEYIGIHFTDVYLPIEPTQAKER